MALRLGVVMDPIEHITVYKDTTLALLLEAQRRGHEIRYMEPTDLSLRDGRARAWTRSLRVRDDPAHWFERDAGREEALADLDAILMRKDPPFDMEYVYDTYVLARAAQEGVLVVNDPTSLREANEKLFTAWFPQCCPPTLVSRRKTDLREFIKEHEIAAVKPLDAMGGTSVFRVQADDPNLNVILETVSDSGRRMTMAQRFIPEVTAGDRRILIIDGEPLPQVLARIPAHGDFRGNLAQGGRGEGSQITEREAWICEQVCPALIERGILFAGLDVIGGYLTEINVTSPTCVRELDRIFGLNIAADLFARIEARVGADERAPQ